MKTRLFFGTSAPTPLATSAELEPSLAGNGQWRAVLLTGLMGIAFMSFMGIDL